MTMTQLKIEKELVTPDRARILLSNRAKNRKIDIAHAKSIASDIRRGTWDENQPHGLVIGKDGRLVDGQTRCTAIVFADTPVMINITYDPKINDAFSTLVDTGIKVRNACIQFDKPNSLIAIVGSIWRTTGRRPSVTQQRDCADFINGLVPCNFISKAEKGRTRASMKAGALLSFFNGYSDAIDQYMLFAIDEQIGMREGVKLFHKWALRQDFSSGSDDRFIAHRSLSAFSFLQDKKSLPSDWRDKATHLFNEWATQIIKMFE